TESQFVEPLSARRQGIFPHQHTAVIPEDSIWPADFLNNLCLGHRHGKLVEFRLRFDDRICNAAAGEQRRNEKSNSEARERTTKREIIGWVGHRVEGNTQAPGVASNAR